MGGNFTAAENESGANRDAELVGLYRDAFAEITAKATPLEFDPKDPERITAYRVPCGPIHRAAGKVAFQMFDGEQHLKNAVEKIAMLKAVLQEIAEIAKQALVK